MLSRILLSRVLLGLGAAALALMLAASPPHAHTGHDHGGGNLAAPADALPRDEAASAAFEIVAVAGTHDLTIYLDRFATGEPVSDAAIEVKTPRGPARATPRGDGIYTLEAPWLPKAGRADITLNVTTGRGVIDVFPLALSIPAQGSAGDDTGKEAVAEKMLTTASRPIPWIMLGIGLIAGVLVGRAGRRRRAMPALLAIGTIALSHGQSLAHEDHDPGETPPAITGQDERAQRAPDGTIFVPKAVQRILDLRTRLTQSDSLRRTVELPGRIIPDPNASGYVQTALGGRLSPPPGGFPRLGTAVKAGDVLGYVTPPVQTVDVSDMRQRQGELDQQIAIVERRLTRYEQLAASEAVSRTQLEETRLELQGLKDRRLSLDRVRQDPETLVAPVSGVIAEGTPIAGQIAQTTQVILQIYDPKKLWVEALSFDVLDGMEKATALTADGKTLPLTFRGAGFADRSQSIPIQFAVEGDASGIRTGQFVIVLAMTGETKRGIAVPGAAIVRAANGQDQIFEQISAERFAPRIVRTAPLDGKRVVILAGIEEGQRIVVQGAELLDHIR